MAEAATLLDASRAMIHVTACAVDAKTDDKRIRRMVSESKKFVTESCQKVVHNAMQVMGGIGYTDIFRVFYDEDRICSLIHMPQNHPSDEIMLFIRYFTMNKPEYRI